MDQRAAGKSRNAEQVRRGWEGVVLKALRAKDFRLTVVVAQPVNERYHRLLLDDGGLLAGCVPHPTMWIRLWFDGAGRPHQRAYTLVDPDPASGRFTLEFAVHDGPAAAWALGARPGDTIDATVQGSRFETPAPSPRHAWVVGDLASVPAVNSLLDALGPVPATVFLEYAHEAERQVPVRTSPGQRVVHVAREDGGRRLVDTVCGALTARTVDPGLDLFWIACEAASTRAVDRHLRRVLGVDPSRVHATAYWRA